MIYVKLKYNKEYHFWFQQYFFYLQKCLPHPIMYLFACLKICGNMSRQKGGDLTQSYDKSPYTHGNVKRAVTTQTTPQKSSIKQQYQAK